MTMRVYDSLLHSYHLSTMNWFKFWWEFFLVWLVLSRQLLISSRATLHLVWPGRERWENSHEKTSSELGVYNRVDLESAPYRLKTRRINSTLFRRNVNRANVIFGGREEGGRGGGGGGMSGSLLPITPEYQAQLYWNVRLELGQE